MAFQRQQDALESQPRGVPGELPGKTGHPMHAGLVLFCTLICVVVQMHHAARTADFIGTREYLFVSSAHACA